MPALYVQRVANLKLDDYDPAPVIAGVNALQALGKFKALEAISHHLREDPPAVGAIGLFGLLRVLFEVPTEIGFPPIRLGQPQPLAPVDLRTLPRFPIVMIQDRPFLAVHSYVLQGLPEPIEDHVNFFDRHGHLRSSPLVPKPADVADLEREFGQKWHLAYGHAPDETTRRFVHRQMLRINTDRMT